MKAAKAELVLPLVRVVKTIQASQMDVFAAWTDPIILAKWYGPPEVSVVEAKMDARVGGRYRIVMHGDSGSLHNNYGVYREVICPERLVFTWNIERVGEIKSVRESLVTVEICAYDESTTEVTLIHELLKSEGDRRGVGHGWSTSLEALNELLREK